jgi:hypothetical protein
MVASARAAKKIVMFSLRLDDEIAIENQRILANDCISIVRILKSMRCAFPILDLRVFVRSHPEQFAALLISENEGFE